MDAFVARQPIFDATDSVVGYELLHRAGPTNRYTGPDAVTATSLVLSENLLSDENWYRLTGGYPAWVNFPTPLLRDGTATVIPPERMVIELLEDVTGDAEVVAACEDLAARGYVLAADDVTTPDDDNPLLDIADVIKVDFRAASAAQRRGLAERFSGTARLVAEKVETRAERAEALDLGYELLQGYYLHEPMVVARRTINRTRMGMLSVLGAVSKDPMDFAEVEGAVKREVAVTDKLLRYLNSVVFGWRSRVTTIRGALVALGEIQVRRWVSVVAVAAVAEDKPDEMIISTLLRARLCEQLADVLYVPAAGLELFLTGLYSQMHQLMGVDQEQMLTEAPVPDTVRRALLGRAGLLWEALELVVAWERGDWELVASRGDRLGIRLQELPSCYARAIDFADSLREMREPDDARAARPATDLHVRL